MTFHIASITISLTASWMGSHHGIEAALILVALLAATALVLWTADRLSHNSNSESKSDSDTAAGTDEACGDSCCEAHSVCPSQMLLEGDADGKCEITYYDDEELDNYRGREAADYSPDDTDRFRDVLYTLLPSDLMGWQRSLKRRGITMPDAIHDEFIMLYNEYSGKGQQ